MRAEPRSMTLVDGLALVAGFAMSIGSIQGPGVLFLGITPGLMLFLFAISILQRTTLALSIVILGRVVSYRRMPRPSEWLAIVTAASALSTRTEFQIDGMVNAILAGFGLSVNWPLSFSGWRWVIADGISILILIGLWVLWGLRRRFAPWAKTLGLTGVVLLAFVGPLWVFGLEGADLFSPRGGFGPGDLSILYREACVLAARFPIGLVFGVPVVAALIERIGIKGRKGWIWTERVALILTALIGILFAVSYRFEFNQISGWWLAERAILLAWTVMVLLLVRVILRWGGPVWGRWIEDPADRDQTSPSPEAPASTPWT